MSILRKLAGVTKWLGGSALKKSASLAFAAVSAVSTLFAAMTFDGSLSFGGRPATITFAALGAACLVIVMTLGYGDIKQRAPMRNQPKPSREPEPFPAAAPPKRKTFHKGGTAILFDDDPEWTDKTSSERRGLRLAWETDGTPRELIAYDFPIVIGRDSSCQAVVSATGVSRRHARIVCENGEYFLDDLGSSNGSAVNGVCVAGRVKLNRGCKVKLGRAAMMVDFI
jgi:hypothetical protein